MTRKSPAIKELVASYRKIKPEIDKRLAEFRSIMDDGRRTTDDEIFSELSFCLLTANANALRCNDAIRELKEKGLLFSAPPHRLKPFLKGRVRFHNKKADFLVGSRKHYDTIRDKLNKEDAIALRDWLVENIKGYGFKESSHFLRNIGLGSDIAILDRHILKNLKKYGVIKNIPDSVGSRKVYLEIEEKMRRFSRQTGIPLDALDLLFWSLQTGFVFK
jgi:N-glycosylase/DNA lyase